eukprot:gnl/Trimastix_PCT/2934.p2 GENE.gnl/Trimastix_PCT/2934~~gnl/Trimastix_PCT/2934.p2  ORF type:complete len:327 (-),score=85.30 gnl/Trimastix_PCT/2934:54-950(-)
MKKNRNLTVAIERERSKNANLQKSLAVLEQELLQKPGAIRPGAPIPAVPTEDAAQLAIALRKEKEKNTQLAARLHETRVHLQTTELKLQKTQRALVREVGEETPLNKVLDEQSNWRGRAQSIAVLKTKVHNLTQQVRANIASAASEGDGSSQTTQRSSVMSSEPKRATRWIEECDRLQAQLTAKTDELEALRHRAEAHGARNKVLEKDTREMRKKLSAMVAKHQNDDALIQALREQVHRRGKEEEDTADQGQLTRDQLAQRCLHQERQISRQDQIVRSLQAEIDALSEQLESVGRPDG